jgi:hypothetical protein
MYAENKSDSCVVTEMVERVGGKILRIESSAVIILRGVSTNNSIIDKQLTGKYN